MTADNPSPAAMRRDYTVRGALLETDLAADWVTQFAGWFTTALALPEVQARLADQGLYPVGRCGADFAALVRKRYDEYGEALRDANIKGE